MNNKVIFLSLIFALLFSNILFGQGNYRTLVYRGNQKFNSKDYDGASAKYFEAIKSNKKEFTAHYNLGNALYKSKKYEEAKIEFERAQKLAQTLSDKAAALHNIGNTYMQLNQPEQAANYYKQSLKQDPYNEATRKNYEIAKLKEKEKEKENKQKKDQQDNSGKEGDGKDQKRDNDKKGAPKDENQDHGREKQNQDNGQQGNEPSQNQHNEEKMPKNIENAILNKLSDKERETARRILNKDSYSIPKSNEKDW